MAGHHQRVGNQDILDIGEKQFSMTVTKLQDQGGLSQGWQMKLILQQGGN